MWIREENFYHVFLRVCSLSSICRVQNHFADVVLSNGASLPPRLPGLSRVLKGLQTSSDSKTDADARNTSLLIFTVVALSYRGYWTSKGRPSERDITLDVAATLAWVSSTYSTDTTLALWAKT